MGLTRLFLLSLLHSHGWKRLLLQVVLPHRDTFNQARDFAWSSDGKPTYVNDAASSYGGNHRVGLEDG